MVQFFDGTHEQYMAYVADCNARERQQNTLATAECPHGTRINSKTCEEGGEFCNEFYQPDAIAARKEVGADGTEEVFRVFRINPFEDVERKQYLHALLCEKHVKHTSEVLLRSEHLAAFKVSEGVKCQPCSGNYWDWQVAAQHFGRK